MPTITAIEPSRRREGRFELLVDGKAHSTVSIDIIERLGLRVGAELHGGTEALERETTLLATYDRAMRMLAFRARAATELRRALIRKGEVPEFVDAAIDRLTRAGFLDDGAFARQFASARAAGGRASRRRIQQELSRRGVARDTADDAIAEVYAEDAVDEAMVAVEAARRKSRSMQALDPAVRTRRLYAFLARRGYGADEIRQAMAAVAGDAAKLDAAD
ncbi:MAG: regulatory protein RecX [Gemmatimonadaceae bacterium]|nr:regulatory protein RecX [Gemmatimonadaceae bacterium]